MQTHTHAHIEHETIEDMRAPERFRRGMRTLRQLRENPGDTNLALDAAVLLNGGRLPELVTAFEAEAEGRELLRTRPAIDVDHVDLDALAALPEGTLGRSYVEFLRARGLTPEVFVPPRQVRDERTRYLAQRLRQTHDLWHVLTGYDTDVFGEVELQAFMFGQLRLPFSFLVSMFGTLKEGPFSRERLGRVWAAYRRGRRAQPLAWRMWERHFATPLLQLKAAFGLAA
ncbi:MAG TPA: Coq4 family protein [Polyangiales bacterium]|nr:Coq4 family protein [Polyangiales bacterium]